MHSAFLAQGRTRYTDKSQCCSANLIDELIYQKTEPWEHEKELMDHEKYTWEGSPSQAAAQTVVTARGTSDAEELLKDYEQVVTDLHNEGEIYILFLSKHQTGISL